MSRIVALLFLLGSALAAEHSIPRKSRQIIAAHALPLAHPNALDFAPQTHVVGPSVHYAQPVLPNLGYSHDAQVIPGVNVIQPSQQISLHPAAFALQQPALQRAYGYVQAALESVSGPSQYTGQSNDYQQNQNSQNSVQSNDYQQNQNSQNSQDASVSSQSAYISQGSDKTNDYNNQPSSTPGSNNQHAGQYDSQRSSTPQPSVSYGSTPSPRPLITPSQSSLVRIGQQNQEQNSGSYAYTQQLQQPQADNSGSQQSGSPSYFRQSTQQSDAQRSGQQYSNAYSTAQSADGRTQSSAAELTPSARTSPQRTLALYNNQYNGVSGPSYASQPVSSTPDQSAAILSQTGDIRYDGSYSYGFQSENGIQASQVGLMRNVGPYSVPVVEGSYSYVAPDGTPISAHYYADHTGFHVQGAHIPTPPVVPANDASSQDLSLSVGQQQTSSQDRQLVAVESN